MLADVNGDNHLDIFCGEMAKWGRKPATGMGWQSYSACSTSANRPFSKTTKHRGRLVYDLVVCCFFQQTRRESDVYLE